MSQVVFLPGFDGEIELRREFLDALAARHEIRAVSYPKRVLGTLDEYRVHAMAHAPVEWKPVLVAESFSGLVAARWASVDSRVQALVLCAAFARNPAGFAASLGASLPSLVKLGPALFGPMARLSGDPKRQRWGAGLSGALESLPPEVVAERLRLVAGEDVGPLLAALAIPIVIVQFDADLVVGRLAGAHLESVCHNAHVLRLPGPHFALETRPAECALAIDQHLRGPFAARA
jgi:pimeloyl-[acyl-carrier protein] methyl ester esterase